MTRMSDYARDLKAGLEDRLVPIEGGPLDGQLMLSSGVLQEVIASVTFPPVDDHGAEVATPATIYVDLLCHICGESTRSTINIESKTQVDDKRRTIAPKIDAETVVHYCGQLPLPVGSGYGSDVAGQGAFDWTIPVEDLGTGIPAVVDMLARVGVVVAADDVAGWTEPERDEAIRWAVAVHVARESDEAIPDAPDVVARDGHPSIVVGEPPAAAEDAPDPTVCPYPDCEKPAEHRGNHGKPRRAKPTAGEADNETAASDDDLLPGEAPPDAPREDWLPDGFDEPEGTPA